MSYQNPTQPSTQELYGEDDANTSSHQRLLPSYKQSPNLANPNVGVSNSSRGQGTTLSEIVSKVRFMNVTVSLFVILFHSLPILLNPIRLTLLLASPIRLILEAILAILAFTLLVVEGRIPVVGQKALDFIRGNHSERQCFDVDTARGRLTALMVTAGACALINYLTIVAHRDTSADDAAKRSGDSHEEVIHSSLSNATFANNSTIDNRMIDSRSNSNNISGSHKLYASIKILAQCTVLSPTMWFIVSLVVYTLYIMRTYPDYVHLRAFSEPSLSESSASRDRAVAVNDSSGGSGYQSSVPSWAKPVI
ncbi:hypothetical protein HJC23_000605 [Cyclotella cryptica]|uniref:Uncharacterized protein n=1 Tax=Cyclotella cryptica TaxID=29204 RepID=A0ABD3NHG6_9STRA|eukprot:CCRYP_020928-RA/>CCRYP_020928-RA protein AED:0.20 eAED:0.20 QI:0/-1/0/1/-1/1/1/0/307